MAIGRTNCGAGGVKPFAAISATFPSRSICTCSDGLKTLNAKNTDGLYLFSIPYSGTWIVSATDGEQTASETVEISTKGQSVTIALGYGEYLFKSGKGALVDLTTSKEDSQCYATIGTETISLGWQTNDRTTACRTSSKINISEYRTLKLDYACTENKSGSDYYEAFGISSSGFSSGSTTVNALNTARTAVSISSDRRIDTLDISGLSGEYYIGIYGAGKIEVYNLWLE